LKANNLETELPQIFLVADLAQPYRVGFSLYTFMRGVEPLNFTRTRLTRKSLTRPGQSIPAVLIELTLSVLDAKCYGSTLGLSITPKWTKPLARKACEC